MGRRVLAGEREQFVDLIRQGISNSEACRIVGVNRRTGTRWRYGRTVINRAGQRLEYPPVTTVRTPCRPRSARYLTLAERMAITDLHRDGSTLTAIAAELGRAVSTISRELRRNRDGQQRYLPNAAQRIASARQARPRERRVVGDAKLAEVVSELLARRWSPEQIAHELRLRFPDQPERQLCTESIYQAVYDPKTPLSRPATSALRSGRRRRRAQSTMALHQQTSALTGMGVYFCEAHSPWQRGSNENANGLLRQYFPKGTDLRAHTPHDLALVAQEINTRPRKTLGWAAPADLFEQLLCAP